MTVRAKISLPNTWECQLSYITRTWSVLKLFNFSRSCLSYTSLSESSDVPFEMFQFTLLTSFILFFCLYINSHPNLLFLFSMSIKQNWWQDSPPGRNYTSFELWPVFLTFGTTTGFVTNIIDPFIYLCGWSDTELMRNFRDSSKTGEMRVAEKEIISQIKLSLFLSSTDYARIFIFYWNLIEASFI